MNESLLEIAESWIGTPWKPCTALKGYGTDCIQFILALYKEFGWIDRNYTTIPYNQDYAYHNAISLMEIELEKITRRVGHLVTNSLEFGDILCFKYGLCASHAGMYIKDEMMIHVFVNRSVKFERVSKFKSRLSSVWRKYEV